MNKALFEVGEDVLLVNDNSRYVVREVRHYKSKQTRHPLDDAWMMRGYWYKVGHFKVHETDLRKLPPPADCKFDELIKQLNTETELQYEHEKEAV